MEYPRNGKQAPEKKIIRLIVKKSGNHMFNLQNEMVSFS